MQDYYKTLGVSRDANARDIKRAYRRLVFLCHPDRSPSSTFEGKVMPIFKEVVEAYQVLSDPLKRTAYDQGVAHLRSEKDIENDQRSYAITGSKEIEIKKIEGFEYPSLDQILRETETWDIRLKFDSYLGLSTVTTFAGIILAYVNGLDSVPFEWIVKTDALEHYKELARNNSPMASMLEVVLGGAIGMGTGLVTHLGVLAVDGMKRIRQYQREKRISQILDANKD